MPDRCSQCHNEAFLDFRFNTVTIIFQHIRTSIDSVGVGVSEAKNSSTPTDPCPSPQRGWENKNFSLL
jgi:hypothetical protein